jgi:hypothetical protein
MQRMLSLAQYAENGEFGTVCRAVYDNVEFSTVC